jgi:diaminopimelate decarboxylase
MEKLTEVSSVGKSEWNEDRLMTKEIADLLQKTAGSDGSPFYLFDLDRFVQQIRWIRKETGGLADICFAMKCNPFLVKAAEPFVDRIEVCSYGEYCICRDAGIAPEKLLISGVLKKPEELDDILEDCGADAMYTAESVQQFELLMTAAKKRGLTLRVYPRMTSGNQFGMDREDIRKVVRMAADSSVIKIEGLHHYSGSQKKKPEKTCREIQKLNDFLLELESEFDLTIPEMEFGPGVPARYFEGQKEDLDLLFYQQIREQLKNLTWKGKVTIEMGRSFAAACGYYVTKVCETKTNDGINYCITDGGMHQLNYDGQIRGMYHPFVSVLNQTGHEDEKEWTVCGCLCTVNDVLCSGQKLGEVTVGDLLAFENAGAYCMFEGMSMFLSHELPTVYTYSREEGRKKLRDEIACWPYNTAQK